MRVALNTLCLSQLAARVDRNNVIEGEFFSPRAALTFKPAENQSIRLTYNRAFSTPANFSFFLDLPQAFNVGGSGFNIRAIGNPPKQGFTYRGGCAGSALADLCMRSRLVQGGAYAPISAAAAFPTLVGANAAALSAAFAPGIAELATTVLPRGGHYMVRAEPEAYAGAVLPFLTGGSDG